MNLREHARGRPCMVRIDGICNHDTTTTVLAHFRSIEFAGIGQKPVDELGAWACSACHDEIDRRTRRRPLDVVRAAHMLGCLRTIYALAREGLRMRKAA